MEEKWVTFYQCEDCNHRYGVTEEEYNTQTCPKCGGYCYAVDPI